VTYSLSIDGKTSELNSKLRPGRFIKWMPSELKSQVVKRLGRRQSQRNLPKQSQAVCRKAIPGKDLSATD
jgi:hypothetical protein